MAGDAARHLRRPPSATCETYWSRYPGRYFAGDGCKRDEEGYYWLLGRVDDVMNVSGHRISTTEVESALVSHPAVAEAAVVGRTDPITGQAIFSYVILRSGNEASDELGAELREHVADMIGKFARPKQIMFTPDLPKTRSGKIMRRLLRDIAEQRSLGDVTTLADANVVNTIREQSGTRRGLTSRQPANDPASSLTGLNLRLRPVGSVGALSHGHHDVADVAGVLDGDGGAQALARLIRAERHGVGVRGVGGGEDRHVQLGDLLDVEALQVADRVGRLVPNQRWRHRPSVLVSWCEFGGTSSLSSDSASVAPGPPSSGVSAVLAAGSDAVAAVLGSPPVDSAVLELAGPPPQAASATSRTPRSRIRVGRMGGNLRVPGVDRGRARSALGVRGPYGSVALASSVGDEGMPARGTIVSCGGAQRGP